MPKIALITGAAQGLGETIARRLYKDGYSIALNDLSSRTAELESLANEFGSATVVTGDVSNEEDVKTMIGKTVEALGSLDVVSSFFLNSLNTGVLISLPARGQRWCRYRQIVTQQYVCHCSKY